MTTDEGDAVLTEANPDGEQPGPDGPEKGGRTVVVARCCFAAVGLWLLKYEGPESADYMAALWALVELALGSSKSRR